MNNSVWPQTTTDPTPEMPAGITEATSTEPVLSPEATSALEALFSRTQGKPVEQGQILPLLTQMGVVNPSVQNEIVGYIFPGAKVAPDSNFESPVIRPEPTKPIDYESAIPEPFTPAPGRKTLTALRLEKMNGGAQNTNKIPVLEPAVTPAPVIKPANIDTGNGALQTLQDIQEGKTIEPAVPSAVTTFKEGKAVGADTGMDSVITDPNLGKIDIPPPDETPEQMAQEDIATLGAKPLLEEAPEPVPVNIIQPIQSEPAETSASIVPEPKIPKKLGLVGKLKKSLGFEPENPIETANDAAILHAATVANREPAPTEEETN